MVHTLFRRTAGLLAIAGFFACSSVHAAAPVSQLRLYTADCGRGDFKDMGIFADTGEYDGKAGSVVMPCFVIRHPKGTLLWDTGLGDKLAANKDGVDEGFVHLYVDTPLMQQLQAIGLQPGDIDYMAFSHFHFDHTGNANAFPGATWLVNSAELAYAMQTPTPFGIDPAAISGYKTAKTKMIDSDYDVFGDGSVRILKAPGHTPGHQVLLLQLKKSGTVVLSGDLYHTRDNRKYARVPAFNAERADTLASIDRIEKLVKRTHARFVIQHDPQDFRGMPKFPAWLE